MTPTPDVSHLEAEEASTSTQADVYNGPPELPYTLRTRKKAICFFWGLFIIDTMAQPLILYFALWYETNLSHNMVFTISTIALGGISVAEYFLRFWALFKKGSTCRPLNHSRRSFLDFFHCNFTLVWLILAGELVAGTIFTEPLIRLLAMPLPTVMYFFGIVHFTLDMLRIAGYKAPFRISSTPKGQPMPTALYPLIEDIISVDGGGGQAYRIAFHKRYHASPYFRHMLFKLNMFWSISAILTATAITISVFMTHRNIAYTLGWTLPFAWAAIATLITVKWVQRDLRIEKDMWRKRTMDGMEIPDTAPEVDPEGRRSRAIERRNSERRMSEIERRRRSSEVGAGSSDSVPTAPALGRRRTSEMERVAEAEGETSTTVA